MRMAAPNIQIGAGHVLIGIKAISAPTRRVFAFWCRRFAGPGGCVR